MWAWHGIFRSVLLCRTDLRDCERSLLYVVCCLPVSDALGIGELN